MVLEKIKDCLSTLANTPTNDNNKFQQVVKDIGRYVYHYSIVFYSTVRRLGQVEEEMMKMKVEMVKVKEQTDINSALIISNEISSLYIEYIIKPALLRVFGDSSWDHFYNKLSEIECEMDNCRLKGLQAGKPVDEEQLYEPLVKFLEAIQKEIKLSLTEIRFLRNDRNSLCHIRHKTVDEQYLLIEKAKKFKFTKEFEFTKQVQKMISSLEAEKASFHRCYI
ncbi:unnamed protein product [Rotaria sp. Silwood2]|nr:unnamed protein product [Rotaria sp. Silwood2]